MDSILDISKILTEYSRDIQNEISEEAIRIGKDGANELKHTSPKRSGRYARSWTTDVEKTFEGINVTIHNKKAYQLTHLLEHSHLLRNGQKSIPIVHIYPVEQKAIKEFETKVEQIIGGQV